MRRSKKISLQNKLRIFNKNVKTVLTYGAEAWRVTKNITNKTQAFLNRCLRYILGVRWPNTITNEDLWAKTQEDRMAISNEDLWAKTQEDRMAIQIRRKEVADGSETCKENHTIA